MKRPTTIGIDEAMRAQIEAARTKLSRGSIRPSMGDVVREALLLGLPQILSIQAAPNAMNETP